jgi:hypothetical protein
MRAAVVALFFSTQTAGAVFDPHSSIGTPMSRSPSSARGQRWFRSPRVWGGGVVLAVVAITASPAVADSIDDFANRLSTLRGEVETLSAELAAVTADGRDELRSLARQKADLELELKKEQIRLQKLRAAVGQKRDAILADQNRDKEVGPLFQQQLEQVRRYVAASLPFRTEQRLAELDKLEEQLRSGLLNAPRALSRLWTFVEDEFRLTRESGLYQQTITLDGQEHLADVVRIGSVALFFKTSDGEVGYAVPQGAGHSYQLAGDPQAKKQIVELFENFRKQIRAGYFELPNAFTRAAATPAGTQGATR